MVQGVYSGVHTCRACFCAAAQKRAEFTCAFPLGDERLPIQLNPFVQEERNPEQPGARSELEQNDTHTHDESWRKVEMKLGFGLRLFAPCSCDLGGLPATLCLSFTKARSAIQKQKWQNLLDGKLLDGKCQRRGSDLFGCICSQGNARQSIQAAICIPFLDDRSQRVRRKEAG